MVEIEYDLLSRGGLGFWAYIKRMSPEDLYNLEHACIREGYSVRNIPHDERTLFAVMNASGVPIDFYESFDDACESASDKDLCIITMQ